MIGYALLKLLTVIVSISLGAALLARDHALPANRLIASVLICNAWWATSEYLALAAGSDAETVVVLYRLMTAGWIPLGVLCMHATLTLSSNEDHPVARLLPIFYGALILLLPAAMTTGFVIERVEPFAMGWRPEFGFGFLLAYVLVAAPIICMLACWRHAMSESTSRGGVELARILFFGVAGALAAGTVSGVLMPAFDIPAFGFTTSLVGLVGVAATVTLKRYGHSLIAPEAFAREILDTLEDGVVLVGSGGLVRDANHAFLRLVGAREPEVLGRSISDWIPSLLAEEAPSDRPVLVEARSRSGERIPVVASPPVECDEAGRAIGRAFVLRDRREVLGLQRQLAVAARLALVGDLSRAISRAIREPVARTRQQLEDLARDWSDWLGGLERAGPSADGPEVAGEGLELVEECIEGVDRISAIVREVGRFAPEHSDRGRSTHNLAEIVDKALRIALAHAPGRIEIESHLDPDVWVLCHRSQIERVVTNLVVNSIQALGDDSRGRSNLVIAVGSQGDDALLHVEDNGCGIEPELVDRIFDPFFTTKPVGKGTGLGLAISYHIVRAHGGEIRVSSVLGRGTSILVELPRVDPARSPDAP